MPSTRTNRTEFRSLALASFIVFIALSRGVVARMAPPSVEHRAYPLACAYVSNALDVENASDCAAPLSDTFTIAPTVLSKLGYDKRLGSLAIRGVGWFYCRRDGKVMHMMTFDNGPDYFAHGYARALVDGKLAYVDRRLSVRVRTRYDWGDRFEKDRADVCVGCTEMVIEGGEHSIMTGGRWGVIDRSGREVVPVTLTQAALRRLQGYEPH